MNTTLEDIDDEPQPHQREPSVGSYTYSIGIFFGALIILIAISYSYYYIIARLKPTDDNSRNTPPIRSHHHHHHRRQRSNRSPMSITSSDYDSESEITSHGIDEATINNRYPMLLFSELVVSHKSGYCGGGGGGGGSGCSICLQDYEGKNSVRLLPECGHFFHAQCVDAWLRIHPNCPICRNSLIVTPPVDNPPAAAVAAAMSVQ